MKLLASWANWLPNVVAIEVVLIVVMGASLLFIFGYRAFRRWYRKPVNPQDVAPYHELPSAESFLDDWTMTNVNIRGHLDPSPRFRSAQDDRSGPAQDGRKSVAEDDELQCHPEAKPKDLNSRDGEGDGIQQMIDTIFTVRKEIKQKNDEITDLSQRLVRQQTASKMAIKEKLMSIRRVQIERKALEQEIQRMEEERERTIEMLKVHERATFQKAKVAAEIESHKENYGCPGDFAPSEFASAETDLKVPHRRGSNEEVEGAEDLEVLRESVLESGGKIATSRLSGAPRNDGGGLKVRHRRNALDDLPPTEITSAETDLKVRHRSAMQLFSFAAKIFTRKPKRRLEKVKRDVEERAPEILRQNSEVKFSTSETPRPASSRPAERVSSDGTRRMIMVDVPAELQ